MKKILALLTILLLVFTLAGCGENTEKTNEIENITESTVKQEENLQENEEVNLETENNQDEQEILPEVSYKPLEYKMAKIGTNEIKSTSKYSLIYGFDRDDYTDVTYYSLMFAVNLPACTDYEEFIKIRLVNANTNAEITKKGDIIYQSYEGYLPNDEELTKYKQDGKMPLFSTASPSIHTFIITALEPIDFDDIKVICDRSFYGSETLEENVLEFNSEINEIAQIDCYAYGSALFSHDGKYFIKKSQRGFGSGGGMNGYTKTYHVFPFVDLLEPFSTNKEITKLDGINVAFYNGLEKVEIPENYELYVEEVRDGKEINLNIGFNILKEDKKAAREFLESNKIALITSEGEFLLKGQ